VFNANYLAYFDLSLTELWRAALGGYQAMVDQGIDVVVADAHLTFRSPAHFDELLALGIEVTRLGKTSITSAHRISREGVLIVEGTVTHVVVELPALTKTAIPDWLRDSLGPWATGDG
jgi:acyl-CoA thioester hydrolase